MFSREITQWVVYWNIRSARIKLNVGHQKAHYSGATSISVMFAYFDEEISIFFYLYFHLNSFIISEEIQWHHFHLFLFRGTSSRRCSQIRPFFQLFNLYHGQARAKTFLIIYGKFACSLKAECLTAHLNYKILLTHMFLATQVKPACTQA